MKYFFLLFSILYFGTLQAQTFEFPKIDYDDMEVYKEGDLIFKKEFKKNGVIVMEAHYPYNNTIQGLCRKSNVTSDSIFTLLGNIQGEIQYARSKKMIYTKVWKKGSNIVTFKNYFSNKKLQESYTSIPKMSIRIDYPGCTEYYNLTRIGEYFKYDESGKELSYKNYDKGTGRIEALTQNAHTVKTLEKLKKKADDLVIKSYGKKFFKNNIKHSYATSTGYHPESRTDRRSNGLPKAQLDNEGWFNPNPNQVTYADFAYNIVMDGNYYPDIILVRVDSQGNIVHAVNKRGSRINNMTRGLIENESKQNFLTKKEVLQLAKKEGLNLDDPNLRINISWVPNSKGDSYGKINYQLLFNKYEKQTYGCSLVYFDEWVVNAITGAFTKDGEKQDGLCMELDDYRKQDGGKYGFTSPFQEEPKIPFEYEMLPSNMSRCMIAKKDGKYGCINHKNETLLNFEYDQIRMVTFSKKRFKNDFVIVKKDNLFGLFDNKGNEILPVKYSKLDKQSEHVISAYEDQKVVVTYNFKKGLKEELK